MLASILKYAILSAPIFCCGEKSFMSRRCKLTGKGPLYGNNVSKAHNKTRRVQLPNLQYKKIFDRDTGRTIRVRLSGRALRTLDKEGLSKFLRKAGLKLQDIV